MSYTARHSSARAEQARDTGPIRARPWGALAEVLRIAADQHVTATEIVLRALRAYVRRYPAD